MSDLLSLECRDGHQFVVDADDVEDEVQYLRCPIPGCRHRVPIDVEDDD